MNSPILFAGQPVILPVEVGDLIMIRSAN